MQVSEKVQTWMQIFHLQVKICNNYIFLPVKKIFDSDYSVYIIKGE